MGTDWLQGKNGPGFLPMALPRTRRLPAGSLRFEIDAVLNDRHMQDCQVSDMLFDIATQIEYISQHARLLPAMSSAPALLPVAGLTITLPATRRRHAWRGGGARNPTHSLRRGTADRDRALSRRAAVAKQNSLGQRFRIDRLG